MAVQWLSLKTGLAAVVVAGAVWAAMPDSMIQNQVIDPMRAKSAHGRLVAISDSRPLNNRYPILLMFGRNSSADEDGPSESEIRRMGQAVLADWSSSYKLWTSGYDFADDTKVFGFWYNSDAADPQIAEWLERKWEAEPDLTRAKVRASVACHSKAGNILICDWTQYGGQRWDAKITSATPHLGTIMADDQEVAAAVERAFPRLGKWLNQLLGNRGTHFDAPGVQWLLPNYPPLMELRRKRRLDASWTLIGGQVQPAGDGVMSRNLQLGWLLDRALLADGNDQDVKAYQVGALVMQKAGIAGGSDGVVPLSSALCEGHAGDARIVRLQSDHNHSQMWWGNGSMELHDAMLAPMMPHILAKRIGQPTQHPTMWLPELPTVDWSASSTVDLAAAQLVWSDDRGRLMVANSQFGDVHELSLPTGMWQWPQWAGDGVLASWSDGERSDVVMVNADGSCTQLTSDGQSTLAALDPAGLRIAFVQNDRLVLRMTGGSAKVLVKDSVVLDAPPVFMGEKLYFSTKTTGGWELRWVSTKIADYPLSKTKLVASSTNYPMRIGEALLAVEVGSSDSELTLVTGRWGAWRAKLAIGVTALNSAVDVAQVPVPTLVVTDATLTNYYLVIDGKIRQWDVAEMVNGLAAGGCTLDQGAPMKAVGLWIDAK